MKVKDKFNRGGVSNLVNSNCSDRTTAFVFLLHILLVSVMFIVPFQTRAQENNKPSIPKVGDTARDFSAQFFDGKPFKLSENTKNQTVLLWFTNLCSGCQSKLPIIEKLNKKSKNKEMEVLAISQLGDDRKTVEDIIRKNNLSVRFLYDPSGEATKLYTGGYTPGTCPLKNIFLINKNGKISFASHLPGVSENELNNQIEQLMKGYQQ